jgi:cytochrome c oxidase cbb3-type subunit III
MARLTKRRKISFCRTRPFQTRRVAAFVCVVVGAAMSLAWLAAPLISQSRDTAAAQPGSAAQPGRRIFTSSCASCHGLDGRGGEHGPDIARDRKIEGMPDGALLGIIRDGVPAMGMPPFSRSLSEREIHAVLAYLRVLEGGAPKTAPPGNPESGRALFFGDGGCAQCHMVNGKGGFIADDLTTWAATQSIPQIREAIKDPKENLNGRSRTAVVSTQDGQTLRGFIRNEDNFSLQVQTLDGAFHLLSRSAVRRVEYETAPLMPADYARRLSGAQINDLTGFLMRAAATADPETRVSGNHEPENAP